MQNARMNKCKALRDNDQMKCARCGLAWDIKDEDRPECKVMPVRLVNRVGDIKRKMKR